MSDEPYIINPDRDEVPAEERDVIDAFDIATINAARSCLREIVERCAEYKPDETHWMRGSLLRAAGQTEGRAEMAEDALFQLLNFAKHHLHIPLTDEQLFNREP